MGRPLGSRDTKPRARGLRHIGRPKGRTDSTPRTPRGSESSRILARRQATPTGRLAGDTSPLRSMHSLDAFFAEQRLRIERTTNRQIANVYAARRRQARALEQTTRKEASTECHVEVRGSCGSDVHLGGDL